MKLVLTGSLASALLLCGLTVAQDATPSNTNSSTQQTPSNSTPAQTASPSAAPTAGSHPLIAPGSVIPVQLMKSLDAKKAKTGDQIDAKVTVDLKAGNGEVIVPKDTKVFGRVTGAQPRSKEQKESEISIAFDHAVMKNGADMTMPMSVQAIISPAYLSGGNNSNGGSESAGPASSSGNPGGGGGSAGMSNGRSGSTGTPQSSLPSPSASGSEVSHSANGPRQPITGNTQGVLGFEDLQLSTASDAKQGSVVTSEKNNVKLDSGTLMLLKVNQ